MDLMFYAPFSCKGDNVCIGIKWKTWKRGFEIFLSANGITEDSRKKNLLLQCVGQEVQDIFFTLPESADTESEQQYDLAMQALDDYYSPKSNTVYERYLFRKLRQQPGESIDQFVTKLLQQGKNCKYIDLNDQVRDQVIEKCLSSELRWDFLEILNIKLEELREIAKAFEATKLPRNLIEDPAAEMPSGGMLSKRIKENHVCSSHITSGYDDNACCKGARPDDQRDEHESTFSVSAEMDGKRMTGNDRRHDPSFVTKTGFWPQ